MSSAGWCCSFEDGDGFWYTDVYPEEVFFEHWTFMAERYLSNPLVIGADLRNEVRGVTGENIQGYYYGQVEQKGQHISLYCSLTQ